MASNELALKQTALHEHVVMLGTIKVMYLMQRRPLPTK
jgi:hypothetical protein